MSNNPIEVDVRWRRHSFAWADPLDITAASSKSSRRANGRVSGFRRPFCSSLRLLACFDSAKNGSPSHAGRADGRLVRPTQQFALPARCLVMDNRRSLR